jgi:hypothetical protein
MWTYRFFLAVDAVALAVALYFFGIGLADGSVSSFNIVLWLALLGGIAAIVGGGMTLNAKGNRRAATLLLAVLAVPGVLAALFLLSILIMQPRWN